MHPHPDSARPTQSRRTFLQRIGVGALGLAAVTLVQGCGGTTPTATTAPAAASAAPSAATSAAASAAASTVPAASATARPFCRRQCRDGSEPGGECGSECGGQHRPLGCGQRSRQRPGREARWATPRHPAQRCRAARTAPLARRKRGDPALDLGYAGPLRPEYPAPAGSGRELVVERRLQDADDEAPQGREVPQRARIHR